MGKEHLFASYNEDFLGHLKHLQGYRHTCCQCEKPENTAEISNPKAIGDKPCLVKVARRRISSSCLLELSTPYSSKWMHRLSVLTWPRAS